MGQAWGNIYMAGQLRVNHHDGTLHGFPGYYFYAAFFKVPIATQIIFLVALVGYFSRRGQPAARGLRREEIFLLVPILVYWIYFNFFFNAQIGIRHVLPVFALATIFCGRFLAASESKLRRYTAVILVVWAAVSTLSYYPHFISYFNEFVPDRKLAYRHLADSNLDWRGNEWYLTEYIRRHPGVIVDPRKPQAGRIVVPVNALVGVNRSPEEYRWLREHFTPVDHIAYSFLVYDVPKEMLPQGGDDSKGPKELPPARHYDSFMVPLSTRTNSLANQFSGLLTCRHLGAHCAMNFFQNFSQTVAKFPGGIVFLEFSNVADPPDVVADPVRLLVAPG